MSSHSQLAGFNPTITYEENEFGIGTVAVTHDGNLYEFRKGDSASIPQYSACRLSNTFDIYQRASSSNDSVGRQIGVPQVVVPANYYAWFLVCGQGRVIVNSSCAAYVELRITTTAGRLDDAAANGQIARMVLTTARPASVGNSPCVMQYPYIHAVP